MKEKILKTLFVAIIMLQNAHCTTAKHIYLEKVYQEKWCNEAGGKTEYRLPDNTRIDCLTNDYAIEFDFASKWAESIGQALYYSTITGKQAGIVLILENYEKEKKYYERLKFVTEKFNIKLWITTPQNICTTMFYKHN